MKCPKCEGKTKVEHGKSLKGKHPRKRVCLACGYSFQTREIVKKK